MKVLFDSFRCLDAVQELQNAAELRFPAPAGAGRANALLNPLGQSPARGWFYLVREDLDQLDLNDSHTVTFTDDSNRSVACQGLYIVKATAVSPGTDSDPATSYLVEVGDARYLLSHLGVPLNKTYNVRARGYNQVPATKTFYADSRNSVGPADWTWQTMVTDLWTRMPLLGSLSTLPVTPDGTPEGWLFPGVSCYHALQLVLRRIGCALLWTPTASSNAYSIVQIGAADAVNTKRFSDAIAADRQLYTGDFVEPVKAKIPAGVRVFFHRTEQDYGSEQTTPSSSSQWLTKGPYSVDVAGPESSVATDSSLLAILWDDLPALYNAAGTLQNSSDCSTRATARSTDFFRMLRTTGGARLHQIYSGVVAGLTGSSVLRGVAWRQDLAGLLGEQPGGLVTEIVRHPFWMMRVDDSGGWVPDDEADSGVPIHPPEYRPTFPVYPHLLQVVELTTSTADGNKLFTATVQQWDPVARTWGDKESCYAVDMSATPATTATSGERYHGRLSGYDATGAPIYSIKIVAAGGAGNDYACRLNGLATTTLATGGTLVMDWNAENYDTGTYHDNSTNKERISFTTISGKHYVWFACRIKINTGAAPVIAAAPKIGIRLNGSGPGICEAVGEVYKVSGDTQYFYFLNCCFEYNFALNDYIEAVLINQNANTANLETYQFGARKVNAAAS